MIKEFILVLTLSGGYGGTSPAVHSVPGFKTLNECVESGNFWLKNLPVSRHRNSPNASAVCIAQTK